MATIWLQRAKLNDDVNKVFAEDQIFRIDHYLGKETVQNILVFRFANGIFEPVWNRNYIDHVQITAAEAIGIEGRGPFLREGRRAPRRGAEPRDGAAVVRRHGAAGLVRSRRGAPGKAQGVARHPADPPRWTPCAASMARARSTAKTSKAIAQEDRVDPNSSTETYAALKLGIENWRWAGVPFYLRAGKRLAKRVTEITIQFKQPPQLLFKGAVGRVQGTAAEPDHHAHSAG